MTAENFYTQHTTFEEVPNRDEKRFSWYDMIWFAEQYRLHKRNILEGMTKATSGPKVRCRKCGKVCEEYSPGNFRCFHCKE